MVILYAIGYILHRIGEGVWDYRIDEARYPHLLIQNTLDYYSDIYGLPKICITPGFLSYLLHPL